MRIEEWNPLFISYMKSQGQSCPQKILEIDRERFPGGVMCGFLTWNSKAWRAWDKINPFRDPHGPKERCEYATWLAEHFAEIDPAIPEYEEEPDNDLPF